MNFWAARIKRNPLPAAGILLLVLSDCAGGGAARGGMPPSVVEVVVAARRDISTSLLFDGQIAPLYNSTLSSPQSGNVTAVYVNEGDRVREGQVLAKIDDATLRGQLLQAQGQGISAQGKLRGAAITQPIQSTQYGSTLGEAQGRVSADRAALRNAKLMYQSDVALYPQGYIAQTALEQSRSSFVAAQQQLFQDEAALRAARVGLGQAQADLQSVESNRGSLEQARGLLQQLHAEIAQTSVYAPFDGIVTARLLDPGAFAGPNAPIVTVSHLDTIYVNANVPDDALSYVHPGTRVAFTTPSFPRKMYFGTIFDLNATPSPGTLSYRARIRYPNPDGRLRGGMLVSVIVPKERHENVVVVPRMAIFQADTGDNLFVVKEGNAVQVPVHVGLQTDTMAEVRGVQPGMRVITSRPDSLQNGSPIIVATQGKQ